jgi:hypothetical protein
VGLLTVPAAKPDYKVKRLSLQQPPSPSPLPIPLRSAKAQVSPSLPFVLPGTSNKAAAGQRSVNVRG